MRSKLFAIDGLDAEQLRALRRPVARRAGAVLLAAEDDRRRALRRCTSSPRRRSDIFSPRRLEQRDAAFLARAVGLRRQHQVLDAHVGERAAHHHLVVAAARAVAVEVGDSTRRARAGRRRPASVGLIEPAGLMWSVVTESPKMPSARAPWMSPTLPGRHLEAVEERRLRDVGRRRPVVDLARRRREIVPHSGFALRDVAVERAVDLRVHREASSPRRSRATSARCPRGRPGRPCPCRPARSSGPSAPCRRSRRRRRAAARRGSSP